MVALAQSDIGLEGGNVGMLPLVNEQPVIHPQAHAVIGEYGEAIGVGLKPHVALPAGGEVIGGDTWTLESRRTIRS